MDIAKWSLEDFVLSEEFRKWVLFPDAEINFIWEGYVSKYPGKLKEIKLAREILINLSSRSYQLSANDKSELWKQIELETENGIEEEESRSIVPLNANSTIKRMELNRIGLFQISQFYRVVAILLLSLIFSFLTATVFTKEGENNEYVAVFTEHVTPPGVKSNLTLTDGSKVILNSGSKIYYQENFQKDKREIFLEGEGYFEIFRDPSRPFIVNTGTISTTALGTSFSINAYKNKAINIYLLSGKVMVMDGLEEKSGIHLEKGESVKVLESGELTKATFDEERVTAWTKGIIIFDQTPIMEAIKIMEIWYGVKFVLKNKPDNNLTVSGKFHNELLQNILIGLSYSARFQFEIRDDTVVMDFIK